MNYKKVGLGALIVLVICFVVSCSGCVSGENSTPQPQPTQNYTIVCCPNPNCPLHDPNGYVSSSGNGVSQLVNGTSCYRPILVNTYVITDTQVHHTYLCQVCGAKWSD